MADINRRVVNDREVLDEADRNPDPITGAPGAHPVGTGLGAASAGAAGAAIGMVAGPIGGAVGAVIGAVAGGLAGKGIAESINPTVEEEYWRENYVNRPYVTSGTTYDTYHPAYQHGWESTTRYEAQTFEEAEPQLRSDWEKTKANSSMKWEEAKDAARDAWERIKHPSRDAGDAHDIRRTPR